MASAQTADAQARDRTYRPSDPPTLPAEEPTIAADPHTAPDIAHPAGGSAANDAGPALGAEGEQLATEAWRARLADREIAGALRRPESRGPALSARYLADIGRRAPLTRARERQLVTSAQAGDRDAKAQLVEAFLPRIASVARLYRSTPQVQRIELLQEGVVGLLRAVERYDPATGTPFWAYASFWVRQAMQQLVSELTRPVVLSDRALRSLARLKDAHGSLLAETGREPDRASLAERCGLSLEQVDDLLATDRVPRALEAPVLAEDGQVGTFGDLLADPLAEDEYERVVDAVAAAELRALLSGLSGREREILRLRHGLDGGGERSLRHVGERLGLSAERVRQLERHALAKLRAGSRGRVAA